MADEFVLTPGGYKPASRVHHLPRGHRLLMNGDVFEIHHPARGRVAEVGALQRHAPGTPLMPANVAKRPPRPPAAPGRAEAMIPGDDSLNGWISYGGWQNGTGSPISRLATTWTVPGEPVNRGSQTVFLFNGIQNATMIYQPVLQWGTSAAGGGLQWAVACWYADSSSGHSFYSDLVKVAPNDVLTGVMSLVDQNGALFSYMAEFDGLPVTQLPIYNVDELTWANETLEAYTITGRNDFPSSPDTEFSAIDLQTVAGPVAMQWTLSNDQPTSGVSITPLFNSGTNGSLEITY